MAAVVDGEHRTLLLVIDVVSGNDVWIEGTPQGKMLGFDPENGCSYLGIKSKIRRSKLLTAESQRLSLSSEQTELHGRGQISSNENVFKKNQIAQAGREI